MGQVYSSFAQSTTCDHTNRRRGRVIFAISETLGVNGPATTANVSSEGASGYRELRPETRSSSYIASGGSGQREGQGDAFVKLRCRKTSNPSRAQRVARLRVISGGFPPPFGQLIPISRGGRGQVYPPLSMQPCSSSTAENPWELITWILASWRLQRHLCSELCPPGTNPIQLEPSSG